MVGLIYFQFNELVNNNIPIVVSNEEYSTNEIQLTFNTLPVFNVYDRVNKSYVEISDGQEIFRKFSFILTVQSSEGDSFFKGVYCGDLKNKTGSHYYPKNYFNYDTIQERLESIGICFDVDPSKLKVGYADNNGVDNYYDIYFDVIACVDRDDCETEINWNDYRIEVTSATTSLYYSTSEFLITSYSFEGDKYELFDDVSSIIKMETTNETIYENNKWTMRDKIRGSYSKVESYVKETSERTRYYTNNAMEKVIDFNCTLADLSKRNCETFFSQDITHSFVTDKIYLKYQTILDIVGNLGGLFSLISTVISFVYSFFIQGYYKSEFTKEIHPILYPEIPNKTKSKQTNKEGCKNIFNCFKKKKKDDIEKKRDEVKKVVEKNIESYFDMYAIILDLIKIKTILHTKMTDEGMILSDIVSLSRIVENHKKKEEEKQKKEKKKGNSNGRVIQEVNKGESNLDFGVKVNLNHGDDNEKAKDDLPVFGLNDVKNNNVPGTDTVVKNATDNGDHIRIDDYVDVYKRIQRASDNNEIDTYIKYNSRILQDIIYIEDSELIRDDGKIEMVDMNGQIPS